MLIIARRALALAAILAFAIAAIVALDFPQPAQAQSDSTGSVDGRIVVRPWVDDEGNLTRVEFGFRPGWGEDVRGGGDGPDDLFPPKRFLTQRLIDGSAGRWLRSSEILIPDADGSEDGVRGRILVRAEADDDGNLTRVEFGFRPAWGEDVRGEQSGGDDIFPTNRFLTRTLIDDSANRWLRSSLISVPAERPAQATKPTEGTPPAVEPTVGEVGAGGGMASTDDGATIIVPPGAAEVGAEVTVRTLDAAERVDNLPEGARDVAGGWDFEVEGELSAPVTIRLPLPDQHEERPWFLAHYTDGEWYAEPFEIVDGVIVSQFESLSEGRLIYGVPLVGPFVAACDFFLDSKCSQKIERVFDSVEDIPAEAWKAAKEGSRFIVGAAETGYSYVKRAGEWVVELGSKMVQALEWAFDRLSHWIAQTVPPLDCEDESDNVFAVLNPGHGLLNICAEDEGENDHRLRVKNMRRFWIQVCPGPLTSPDLRRAPNVDVFGPLSNCALDGGTLLPSGREAEWISQLDSLTEIRASFSDSAALMTMVDWILAILGASDISGKIGLAVDILASLRELPAVSQLIEHAEAGRVGDMLQELGRILTSTHALKHISNVIAKAAPSLGVEFGVSVIQTALILVELGRVPLKLYDLLSAYYSKGGIFAAASFERTDRTQEDEPDDEEPDVLPPIGDGSLMVLAGTSDLYQAHVVDGSLFKRLILNSVVFDGYGFQLSSVRSVEQAEFDRWATTDLARLGDDGPVWQLFPDGGEGVRRWLDITPQQFEAAGFDWDAVISINQIEFGEWRAGPPITAAELGLEDAEDDEVDEKAGRFIAVSARSSHTCGLRESREIECWGDTTGISPTGRFSAVSAGSSHTCGLREDGEIVCSGWNEYGQADAPAGRFTAVSAGSRLICAVRELGELACWGANETPVTHWSGGIQDQPEPIYGLIDSVPSGRFSAISVGYMHICAVRELGEVVCWGYNKYGQSTPPAGRFSAVGAGLFHTCGLRENEEIECWGGANYGVLDAPAGSFSAISVSAWGWHACGLRETGEMECWGYNEYGQTDTPAGRFTAVSAGYLHTCGLREDGEIACWGWNEYGQTDAPGAANTVTVNVNEPPRCDDIADVGPLSPGEASERIRLSNYCREPENESLRYAVTSSDEGVATASISDGSLIVAAARASGTATITLTATDPGGLTAQTSFRVTVRERAPEPPEISIMCPEYAETGHSFVCRVHNRGGAATSWDWSASGGAVGGRSETYSVRIGWFGRHIVRLTASNAGGSDSDSATVRLVATPPHSQYSRCGSDTIKVYWFDRGNFRKHHVNLTGEEATRILGPDWWATIGHLSQPACDSWPTGAPVTAENYR